MQKINTDILILGGGLSGLSAAHMLLAKGNRRITILEKDSVLGGLARTIFFNGYKYDLGGHRFCFRNKENIDYLMEVLPSGEFLKLKRKVKIFLNNKYLEYPPNFSAVFNLGLINSLKVFFEMLNLSKYKKNRNFEEWVKSNYGEYLFKIYFKDYTEKVWGQPCSGLSNVWANGRIGSNNLFKVFQGVFLQNYNVKDAKAFFYYPKRGIGSFVEKLEEKLADKVDIFKDVKIGKFCIKDKLLKSLDVVSNNQTLEISFKKVISSIPVKELLPLFSRSGDLDLESLIPDIRYRSLIVVFLPIAKKMVFPWHWCYFPSKEIIFSRIHEPKLWSSQMSPENETSLVVEIFCSRGDQYWSSSDEAIIRQVKAALFKTGLVNPGEAARDAEIRRVDYAYPLCYNNYEKPLNLAKDRLGFYSNLFLLGRSGTHSYFDMEECIDDVRGKIKFLQ